MVTPVFMPKLGMTMQEGRVLAWMVPVGARVDRGRPLLSIESEKAEVEIEAPATGLLRFVYVEAERTVPCGTLLAAVADSADEAFDAESFRSAHDLPGNRAPQARATTARADSTTVSPSGRAGAVTPAARARARQLGVDPAQVLGSGPGGRITREDVEAWAANRSDLIEVARGIRLEGPSTGAGEPVVLLPGFGTDVSALAPQALALAQRFRVHGLNPRGVGRSDAPPAECYDLETAAADAAAIIDQPAHVIGASLGAAVAIELALAQPGKVRSLTLITPLVETNPRLLAVIDSWCRLAGEVQADTLALTLLPWLFSSKLLADATARERTARGLAAIIARVPAATLERTAAGVRAWSGTRTNDLVRITTPTLVLVAGSDLLTPGGEQIAAAIPGARLEVVPEAGHALAIEAADAVNAAILAHLGCSSRGR